jgi:hypothetical protein
MTTCSRLVLRVSDYGLTPSQQFFRYIMARTSYIQWEDVDAHFVLNKHDELYFCGASSMKQQSVGGHVDPLGNIIPIPCQTVFALSS